MAKLRVDKIAAPIVKDEFTGSVFFDGTGDYLSIPDSTDFDLGLSNEPFTIEFWFYKNSAAGTHSELGVLRGGGAAAWNGSNGHQYRAFQHTDNTLYWQWWNGSAQKEIVSTETPAINTWHHFAISYDGGTTRAFLNGVVFGTSTEAYGKPSASNITRIGQDPSDSVTTHGYHSNVRICKGHALYTKNFTPSTRELPVHKAPPKGVVFPAADNLTVLLACQSSTDATAEATGRHTITANGNAHAQSANPGLFRRTNISSTITENTGSVYFDGTDDSLNIAANADFAYGTGDFTWEFWFKTDAGFVEGNGGYLIDHAPAGSDGNDGAVWVGSNTLYYHSAPLGGVTNLSFGGVSNETWYHVAVARESGTTRLFLNGALVNSASDSANYTTNNTRFRIGDYIGTDYAFKGYISNLRICKGHAVYTSNFAPPTRELEVHQGPDDDRTVLLCCYDGENIFADKTGRHIIFSIGDRQSTPTQSLNNSPIGITTVTPGLTRNVDPTAGPTFQGGAGFTSQNWLTLPKGTTTERFPDFGAVDAASARGVFAGGLVEPSPTRLNTIDYITISTLGNAQDFGDLVDLSQYPGGVAGSVRGVIAGGYNGSSFINTINYVTIASTGDAKDFGDLTLARNQLTGASNSTRGLFAGGNPETEIVDYITIQSQGNAFDFGDLLTSIQNPAGCADSTRALFGGGEDTPTSIDVIQYFNISTTSNSTDFGNLTQSRRVASAGSSKTRGLFAGGRNPGSTQYDIIDFVTIQTLGNATDFGNLSATRSEVATVTSTLRACFGGGYASPNSTNIIEYVTIPSAGNAIDFGDLTVTRRSAAGVSNGHGGLG